MGVYSAEASVAVGGKDSKSSSEIDKNETTSISSIVSYFVSAILMATDVFHCSRVATQGKAILVWVRWLSSYHLTVKVGG